MAAIFSRSQCVNLSRPNDAYICVNKLDHDWFRHFWSVQCQAITSTNKTKLKYNLKDLIACTNLSDICTLFHVTHSPYGRVTGIYKSTAIHINPPQIPDSPFHILHGDMMPSSNRNIFRVTGHLWGNSPVQWRAALMFSLICTCINGWVNNSKAGDLRRHRHRAHYDVIVMDNIPWKPFPHYWIFVWGESTDHRWISSKPTMRKRFHAVTSACTSLITQNINVVILTKFSSLAEPKDVKLRWNYWQKFRQKCVSVYIFRFDERQTTVSNASWMVNI